ncbi:MAG TPA: tautomerase family protein [Microvirga sp.]|jgi:4-oxalocrotonate tautomerase|nr:tautomerase family protein [Microvirga sp.]
MPLLTLKVSHSEGPALVRPLAEAVTDLTASVLRKKRDLTAVVADVVPPDQWTIGGRTLAEQGVASFALEIRVTAGTNPDAEKAAYVEAVFDLMRRRLGPLHDASYVIVQDVPAEAWGFGGRTQAARYAAPAAAA